MAKKKSTKNTAVSTGRPPIVAVLGHVDHGKTTLLDTIRKTTVAQREHGGITQHIGAYTIEIDTRDGKKKITFIDTPGHEAFAKMRSHGAAVADIAILVVSASDGVMPQTIEAISHIKAAKVPVIVAANKIDLPEANIDRVKQQLAKADILVEGFGGDTVVVPVSAKKGTGIPELLDMILLVSEMTGLTKEDDKPFSAVVIESKHDRQRGPIASIIVKTGLLHIGQSIRAEAVPGKVRAMINSMGIQVKVAYLSDPVEILGFTSPPPVGATVIVSEPRKEDSNQQFISQRTTGEIDTSAIKLIVKADTTGTLDAVYSILPPDIHLVLSGVGDITESDVLFAKTTGAIIVGFGVGLLPKAQKLAVFERVMVKTYNIIYKLAEEVSEVVQAIKEGRLEEVLGMGEIMTEFPFDKDRVAGVRVKEGRLAKGDQVKILRGETEIGRSKIKSMRQLKEEVNKVEMGKECGVIMMPSLDFQSGDDIISYR